MGVKVLNVIKEQAAGLTPEENLELIAYLLNKIRISQEVMVKKRRWREICGKVKYPLAGEDAQIWVTKTRKESDAKRKKSQG